MWLPQRESLLVLTASVLPCTPLMLVRPHRRMTQGANPEGMWTPTSKYFCQFSPWLCEVRPIPRKAKAAHGRIRWEQSSSYTSSLLASHFCHNTKPHSWLFRTWLEIFMTSSREYPIWLERELQVSSTFEKRLSVQSKASGIRNCSWVFESLWFTQKQASGTVWNRSAGSCLPATFPVQ